MYFFSNGWCWVSRVRQLVPPSCDHCFAVFCRDHKTSFVDCQWTLSYMRQYINNNELHIQVPSSCRLGLCSPAHSTLALRICWRTASTMGITIVTAEVFWTHMERKAQPDMKPKINLETMAQTSTNSSLHLDLHTVTFTLLPTHTGQV